MPVGTGTTNRCIPKKHRMDIMYLLFRALSVASVFLQHYVRFYEYPALLMLSAIARIKIMNMRGLAAD